jgi:putative membrane protein
MTLTKILSQHDLDRISAAVTEAEGKTSGEIVPYIVEQSDSYEEALWRGAGLVVVLALFSMFSAYRFTDWWFPIGVRELALLVMLKGSFGAAAVYFIPPLKRFFAGRDLMDRKAKQRAQEAFLAEEVFNTRDRTGILIFVSLLEHEVVVLGDSGINAKVEQREWDEIVSGIVREIKAGRVVDGLIVGIREAGNLLHNKEVTRRADDRDELADGLRIGGKS